jgi:hypothetical protein
MNTYKFIAAGMVIALATASCIKLKSEERVGYHYMTNMSGKRIVHEVICNPQYVDKDTLRFFSGGKADQAELEWVISVLFPNYREVLEYYWRT